MRQERNGNDPVRRGSGTRRSKVGAGVDSMFRVFADHTRLRILRLLQDGPLCVGDLVDILRAPQPTVSRHLAYLRRSGFVETRQHGLWMFYQLAPTQSALHGKLLECLAVCASLLPEVNADLGLARRVRRSGGCCPEGRRLMEQFECRRGR
ncbi:MAG TPA: metalloregulator ArsR/SmtB family transcription factor [Candidatus Kryptonia bacterium]|nr:metalloregulator ArsR/SmtB family transcription factor [Candidatus Kryptonia bacterium]